MELAVVFRWCPAYLGFQYRTSGQHHAAVQVERLQRKFATIHSTLAQQMSSKPDPEAQSDEAMISQSQALDGLSKVSPQPHGLQS